MGDFSFNKNNKREEKSVSYKELFKLFEYIKPRKWTFIIGMIFLLLSSLTAFSFPALMGKLLDSGVGSNESEPFLVFDLNDVNSLALLLLVIFILQAIFSFFRIYLFSDVTERMLANLRMDTYEHLIRLPMDYFSKHRVGELNSRISSDIGLLQEMFTTTLAEFLRQSLIIALGIFALFFLSFKLTLLMLVTLPVLAVAVVFFGKFIKGFSKQAQEEIAHSNVIVEETLSGISSVKGFANEMLEVLRYRDKTEKVRQVAMKSAKWRAAFAAFIIITLFGGVVLVIWFGVQLREAGEISREELFTFILYSVFIAASFGGVADHFSKIQKAAGATEDLLNIRKVIPEDIVLKEKGRSKKDIKGEIEFSNMSFKYEEEGNYVLKNIDLKIKKGWNSAIVGPSGAGKSTLASLLLRFYEPTKGEIRVDGKDIMEYDLTYLRSQMAIVPQEVFLFGGTIKENISYGKPNATNNEIEEAAKKANAMAFIKELKEGIYTEVGERGIKLSGGQRQRIAIARAILKDPSILLLDEATSSLDSESEFLVQEALENLMKNRTSIVIAHRLSTVRNADEIIVLDEGTIVEQGSHEELLTHENGLYKRLSELQLT
ncbi:MAG: ABC transporter ATP-binding protein [Flavobacteriales bacterium]